MLAAVRSTSCHAGGKPTGYISLMDNKGGGRERENGQWGVRGRVALANGPQNQRNQRNFKNNGNTDFAHGRELQRCELSERPEFHQAPCEPPKENGKGSALKLLNKLASGPPHRRTRT